MKLATPRQFARNSWHRLKYLVEGPRQRAIDNWMQWLLPQLTATESKMLMQLYDDHEPLPSGATQELSGSSPRLQELRAAYSGLKLPVNVHTQWNDRRVGAELDLRYFRGDNPFIWHYREWPRATTLKYYIHAQYIHQRDPAGLLKKLGEDGAFGCWNFDYPGVGRVSRDLLDAVNEILFLDRQLNILKMPGLHVLDIGAGYGRLAYRMIQAKPELQDYCCVDAIPESTFLCEYYLRQRGCLPPARVVPLHQLDAALKPDHFDLAVNIHSFSECTYDAVAWWADWLRRLRVPNLLIIPNEPTEFLTTETDGSKRDYRSLIEAAGYELAASEPVLNDPAVQELLRVHDNFFLFRRKP